MNWLKVVRSVRGVVWGVAAGLAVYTASDVERRMFRIDEDSTLRQSTIALVGILELLCLLIAAVALDRILELRERGMLESAAKRPLPTNPV